MTDRIVVGEDMRGNQIVYQNNHDGTWTNLLQEIVYPEDFILAHFSHLITEYHDQDHSLTGFIGTPLSQAVELAGGWRQLLAGP